MDAVFQAGVISGPLQAITEKFTTLVIREASAILGVDEEVRRLQRAVERMRALVGHVEESRTVPARGGVSGEAWKVWLIHVEDLLYRADNVLDEISLDLLKHKANNHANNQVRSNLLSQLKLTVPHEIRSVREELDVLYGEMDGLFMIELTKLGCCKFLWAGGDYNGYSCASFLVKETSVVGREREKNEIVEKVLNEDLGGDKNVSVISIVGMGGVGKTTLTQVVYNDDRVTDSFQLKMWVSVSMDFDVVRITKSIIESASGKRCKMFDLDPIQIKLRGLISGRRFLLVLDDYWSERRRDWDVISSPFMVGARGSKIIVTTRSTVVSRVLNTIHSCYLECLSDENCWELMKHRARSNKIVLKNEKQVEKIGRMIAKKCGGLPLAATTLGSVLYFKDSLTEWKGVLENEIWDLPHNDIFAALSLSYYHLPAHLKMCFIYCSEFPKNHEFEMNELVLLWIAQGFIHPTGKILLEDVGNSYFQDLLWRSFFQLSQVNRQGQNTYKMHDLIHDMAKSICSHTCLYQEVDQLNEEYAFFKSVRHLSLYSEKNVETMTLKGYDWYKSLRTFRVVSEGFGNFQVSYGLFTRLKFLRELDLSRMRLDNLPDSIGEVKCLRHLNLSENHFKQLPESITNLFGLLVLKLERNIQLLQLPRDMKNMSNLRHLHLNVKQLHEMPSHFGKLINLVSLSAFIVGKDEGHNIGELKHMRLLRGSICIKNLEDVANMNVAKEAMLDMKPFLDKLELEWKKGTNQSNAEEVLAGLRPHENLKELMMRNYSGYLLPGWLSDPLCQLSRIHLRGCQHFHVLYPLGKLQHLESLVIEDMSSWCDIQYEFSGFPSLVYLKIEDIPNLTSWTSLQGFRSLRTLDIIDCPKLTNLPSDLHTSGLHYLNIHQCHEIRSLPEHGLPHSLQALAISESDTLRHMCRVEEGEDWYKIRFIPKIEINFVEITQGKARSRQSGN